MADGLPGGDLRAVEVDFCVGGRGGDADFGLVVLAGDDLGDSEDGVTGVELFDNGIQRHGDSVAPPRRIRAPIRRVRRCGFGWLRRCG